MTIHPDIGSVVPEFDQELAKFIPEGKTRAIISRPSNYEFTITREGFTFTKLSDYSKHVYSYDFTTNYFSLNGQIRGQGFFREFQFQIESVLSDLKSNKASISFGDAVVEGGS